MSDPWGFRGAPDPAPADTALIEGSTFSLSDTAGDMNGGQQGLFVRDTRVLSAWSLEIDGRTTEPLASERPYPFHGVYITRARGEPDGGGAVLVRRDRFVGHGMREDITVRNESRRPRRCIVRLRVAADFADLFEVKEGKAVPAGHTEVIVTPADYHARTVRNGLSLECRVQADGEPTFDRDGLCWTLDLPARASERVTVEVVPVSDGSPLALRHPRGQAVEDALPAMQLREWRERVPQLSTSSSELAAVLRRSVEDLGVLRIYDPDHPDRAVIAAGAPWFMALFGRDSLLTSLMLTPLEPSLALGTLRTLAEHQGSRLDAATEEAPGRILHELRFGPATAFALNGRGVYYGTADATALFVVLAGELARWGNCDSEIAALMEHVDRALAWITGPGDADGDGLVEYQRTTRTGLANQGWKDSWDGINFADGRIAQAPIALAEVQAYSYAAFLARARLSELFGDDTAAEWRRRAALLKEQFNERFWLPDRGWYAVGLDADKQPIDSLTSNIGHCLWAGIVEDEHAESVADQLMSDAMFSGWGIRTLATTMAAYDPVSYHNGSVWPHDNAICAAGLRRYGFDAEAGKVAAAMIEAATHFDHRLPELFCGFSRAELTRPVPYPAACAPQAWAAATPVQLLTTMLGLEPRRDAAILHCQPAVPPQYLPMSIGGLTVSGQRQGVDVLTDGRYQIVHEQHDRQAPQPTS